MFQLYSPARFHPALFAGFMAMMCAGGAQADSGSDGESSFNQPKVSRYTGNDILLGIEFSGTTTQSVKAKIDEHKIYNGTLTLDTTLTLSGTSVSGSGSTLLNLGGQDKKDQKVSVAATTASGTFQGADFAAVYGPLDSGAKQSLKLPFSVKNTLSLSAETNLSKVELERKESYTDVSFNYLTTAHALGSFSGTGLVDTLNLTFGPFTPSGAPNPLTFNLFNIGGYGLNVVSVTPKSDNSGAFTLLPFAPAGASGNLAINDKLTGEIKFAAPGAGGAPLKSASWDILIADTNANYQDVFGEKLDGFQTLHLNVTAAVPEPETYALFLAGLGAIGVMVRRRKQAA